MKSGVIFFFLLNVFAPVILSAQDVHDSHASHNYDSSQANIGIHEKLGERVPLDLSFRDEAGRDVSLKEIIDKPTILCLVYYTCPSICPRILSSTAQVLGRLQLDPEKDFSVITVSFDENDTPSVALQRKKNYVKAIGKPFPEDAWKFLTGDEETIRMLTDAAGFHFQRRGDAFEHPASLIILAPDGKIVRYLYGLTYLPFDVKMALTEAQEGTVSPTIRRVLLYCFSYDPEGRTYVFNILKVAGVLVLSMAAMFTLFLVLKGRSKS